MPENGAVMAMSPYESRQTERGARLGCLSRIGCIGLALIPGYSSMITGALVGAQASVQMLAFTKRVPCAATCP